MNDPKEKIMKDFGEFMDKAHSLGYVVAVDTNPEVFKHLGATYSDLKPFHDMGVDVNLEILKMLVFDGNNIALKKIKLCQLLRQ